MACRICLEEDGVLIQPCDCKGSTASVHRECLERWVKESNSEVCEICTGEYAKRDVRSCNLPRYCEGLVTFAQRSEIEKNLIRLSSFVAIFGMVMYSWTDMGDWTLMTSVQTLTYVLTLTMLQIYRHDTEFFVLNVSIWWGGAFFLASLLVGTVRTMDSQEMCAYNCHRLSRSRCNESCVAFEYYDRKETVANHSMFLNFVVVGTLVGIKSFVLCFTHMKTSVYYNRRVGGESGASGASGASIEETSSLLV